MDDWIDRWKNGQMDGWTNYIDGLVDKWIDRQTNGDRQKNK